MILLYAQQQSDSFVTVVCIKEKGQMGLKTQIKNHFIARNYYLTKKANYFWYYINSRNKHPLVVYQMGKVGSMSIVRSLQASDVDFFIFHVHVLTHENIRNVEKEYFPEERKIFRRSFIPETNHLFTSYFLRTQLDKVLGYKKWKFITLVREPISRNVSYFFHSIGLNKIERHLPADFYERYQTGTLNTEELTERYLERFHENSVEYNIPLEWFDFEFMPALGIDVYSTDFSKTKGYQIYEGDFADVLLLKLESISKCASDAFKKFLDLENFILVTDNTARHQRYYPIYREFLRFVDLPGDYVNRIYDSKYVQHFYSAEEINSFRKRWHKHQ